MRDIGIPKVMTWRWAPCVALVLGSLSFVAFALLVIPDQIGSATTEAGSALRLGNHFAANQTGTPTPDAWSSNRSGSDTSTRVDSAMPDQATRVATHGPNVFPKRGFTPPLERPAPPPPALPPPPVLLPPPPPPPAAPSVAPPAAALARPPAPDGTPVPMSPSEAPPAAAPFDLPPPGAGPTPGPLPPQAD